MNESKEEIKTEQNAHVDRCCSNETECSAFALSHYDAKTQARRTGRFIFTWANLQRSCWSAENRIGFMRFLLSFAREIDCDSMCPHGKAMEMDADTHKRVGVCCEASFGTRKNQNEQNERPLATEAAIAILLFCHQMRSAQTPCSRHSVSYCCRPMKDEDAANTETVTMNTSHNTCCWYFSVEMAKIGSHSHF